MTSSATPTLRAWRVCEKCGKEFQGDAKHTDITIAWCEICSLAFYENENHCPEVVHYEPPLRGVSACLLSYHHEGRCQPVDPDDIAMPADEKKAKAHRLAESASGGYETESRRQSPAPSKARPTPASKDGINPALQSYASATTETSLPAPSSPPPTGEGE